MSRPGRSYSGWDSYSDSTGIYQRSNFTFVCKDSAIGSSITNWRSRILNGQDATTAYTRLVEVFKPPFALSNEYVTRDGALFISRTGKHNIAMPDAYRVSFNTHAPTLAQCGISFGSNLYDQRVSLETGTFMGELRQTLNMITRPGKAVQKSLARYVDKVKDPAKALRREARRAENRKNSSLRDRIRTYQEDMHDAWLTTTLGIQPLLADIDGAAKAVSHWTERPATEMVRASASNTITGTWFELPPGTYLAPCLTYTYEASVVHSARAVACVFMTLAQDGRDNDRSVSAEDFGLTLQSFVPTIYNLIPYSFILDYFSNLGDYVKAKSTTTPYTKYKYTSYKKVVQGVISYRNAPSQSAPPYNYVRSGSTGNAHYLGMLFKRYNDTPYPAIEGLRLEVPGVKQMLNIGALLSAADSSRFR